MKVEIWFNVLKGKINPKAAGQIKSVVESLEGKGGIMTISTKNNRSNQQNRLWWSYMTILSNDLGYTPEEIHEICKYKFLKKAKVDEATGLIMEYLGSTAELSKSEFTELVENMTRWSAENFNIVLPTPDSQLSFNE